MAGQTRSEMNKAKQELWTSHVEAWKESGLSQIDYCRHHDLSKHRFTYWKCKLDKQNTPIKFIHLTGNSVLSQKRTSISLALGEYKIEIGDGFRPETLSTLIRTLRGI